MAMKMFLLAVTIFATSPSDASFVGRKAFLANGLQPEVVALTLSHVEDEWRAQAGVFADCDSTAALPGAAIVNCKDAPNSFGKSCATVVSAIIQGSGGDRDVAKEYMADVCSQRAITGWHQQQCNALAITIKGAMGADRYQNRMGFNTAKLCTGFWSRFLTEEKQRIAKENADHEADEKKAAEEVADRQKAAEAEAAHKKVAEADSQKATEAAHKNSEAEAKAAEARANAAEVAVRAAEKKAQAVAVARAAKDKMATAQVAKTEDKKANKDVAKVAVAVAKSAASAKDKKANKKAKVAAAAQAKVFAKDAKKATTKPSKAVATGKAVSAAKVDVVAKPAKEALPATSKVAKAVLGKEQQLAGKTAVAPAPLALVEQDPCAGCTTGLAQSYQTCASKHGNPCAETNAAGIVGSGPGKKKDIGCCMKKEKHDRCVSCSSMDCAHGTCNVNKKYYNTYAMKEKFDDKKAMKKAGWGK